MNYAIVIVQRYAILRDGQRVANTPDYPSADDARRAIVKLRRQDAVAAARQAREQEQQP